MGNFEWSGELITREEGTINDLDDWKIICEDIYLADIGSGAYTSYTVDKGGFKSIDIVEMYDKFDGLMEGTHKAHHIHSHHNMSAFFSSTDKEQLHDRALCSNYFLMLIVNFDGQYCAKVAFKAKKHGNEKTQLELFNNSDGYNKIELKENNNEDVLVVMACNIEYPEYDILVEKDFSDRFEAVKKVIEEEKKMTKPVYRGIGSQAKIPYQNGYDEDSGWGGIRNEYFKENDYEFVDDGKDGYWRKKSKKITEMTQKEWEKHDGGRTETYDLRHAKALLNSLITGSFDDNDYSDPIIKFTDKQKKLKNAFDVTEFVMGIDTELRRHFDVIFPHATDADFGMMLLKLQEYLIPYKYLRIINEFMECIEEEIEELTIKIL